MGPINIDESGMWNLARVGYVTVVIAGIASIVGIAYVFYRGVWAICCGQ